AGVCTGSAPASSAMAPAATPLRTNSRNSRAKPDRIRIVTPCMLVYRRGGSALTLVHPPGWLRRRERRERRRPLTPCAGQTRVRGLPRFEPRRVPRPKLGEVAVRHAPRRRPLPPPGEADARTSIGRV